MGRKKFFTAAQANAMLPLVSRIVQDISSSAHQLRERLSQLEALQEQTSPEDDRVLTLEAEVEQGREQLGNLVEELQGLGILLKDFFVGLVDFPCLMDGREVYLCWKLGEPAVDHWHEVDAGFAGRKKLQPVPAADR